MNWNWRTTLGVVLFVAAVISGWSAWKQRARPAAAAVQESGADYILRDFELIALDKQSGKESMTLRAPEMHRNRADQTADITTPVFLMPDNANLPWT
ncbi:LPS export ABC transporter periplasmic protein LptC, partial [Xanthomonas perforans]